MAKYAGRKGVVYISTTGSGNASIMAGLTEWSINRATDKIEVTSFGESNKTYVQGLPDVSGSFNGFWDHADTKLFTAAGSTDGCKIYLYPSSDNTGAYHYGPAWLDASMTTNVNGAVEITSDFVANGSWSSVGISA
jgi:hypothetical protein